MTRVKGAIYRNEIFLVPTIGVIKKTGGYRCRYLIAFAWLHFRISIRLFKQMEDKP